MGLDVFGVIKLLKASDLRLKKTGNFVVIAQL